MKKIVAVLAALLLVLLSPFLFRSCSCSSGKGSSYRNESGSSSSGRSIDGTYYWSDGISKHTVRISGNTWRGETQFGPGDIETESGTVRGNTLYYSGMEIGRVAGSTLSWGGSHILTKR